MVTNHKGLLPAKSGLSNLDTPLEEKIRAMLGMHLLRSQHGQ